MMADHVTISDTITGTITAVTSAELTERGVLVTIGTHTYILDLDTAKALRDQLKVVIGSVE